MGCTHWHPEAALSCWVLCRGPRFQKFMEEFQQEQQGSAEAAGAAGTVHMRSKI